MRAIAYRCPECNRPLKEWKMSANETSALRAFCCGHVYTLETSTKLVMGPLK